MSRQYTREEMQRMFLDSIEDAVRYWACSKPTKDLPVEEKLDGLAFSILCMLDGVNCGLPAFEVYSAPHPTDKAFCQEEGSNWWPDEKDGVNLHGGCMLHDLWGARK